MRVWDVPAGYLNRQSLLAEHAEVHGLYSILLNGKKGYSRHPETLRWAGCLSGLAMRHEWLAAEMRLRGFSEKTPLKRERPLWPQEWVTPPGRQYDLLKTKYAGRQAGRIPLPRNPQELWAHHKYSVMARDLEAYHCIGRWVAGRQQQAEGMRLAQDLVLILRQEPSQGRLFNALEHMWGHVSAFAAPSERQAVGKGASVLLHKIQELALRFCEPYLLASTALCDLEPFLRLA